MCGIPLADIGIIVGILCVPHCGINLALSDHRSGTKLGVCVGIRCSLLAYVGMIVQHVWHTSAAWWHQLATGAIMRQPLAHFGISCHGGAPCGINLATLFGMSWHREGSWKDTFMQLFWFQNRLCAQLASVA